MLILGAAALLGLILTRAHVSRDVAAFLGGLSDNPWVFMILVNILLLILGCLIDATAIILVTVPVLLPIALELRHRPDLLRRSHDHQPDDRPADPTGRQRALHHQLGHGQAGRRRLPRNRTLPDPAGRGAHRRDGVPGLVLWLPTVLGF